MLVLPTHKNIESDNETLSLSFFCFLVSGGGGGVGQDYLYEIFVWHSNKNQLPDEMNSDHLQIYGAPTFLQSHFQEAPLMQISADI